MSYSVQELKTLGFRNAKPGEFKNCMDSANYFYAKYFQERHWVVCEDDLELENGLEPFGDCNVLVLGDLKVRDYLEDDGTHCIFVLGDTHAKNYILSGPLYFGGETHFDEALIAHAGNGTMKTVTSAFGPFAYSDCDGAQIGASPENVDVFLHESLNEGFGEVRSLVMESYLNSDPSEGYLVESSTLISAIKSGESILLPKGT